jgi:predicted TIM-barrel fold metal-dependent hydrolase
MREETAQLDPRLFLPEPTPREVKHTIISVDDHVVEPSHTFEGRLPTKLAAAAPRVVETAGGRQMWEFDGRQFQQVGLCAVSGRRRETVSFERQTDDGMEEVEPYRFDEMRPGCYDIRARIRDMDINGVWASLNFPSRITGFCGRVLWGVDDQELGLACTRAWNDWLYEEWYSAYPERIIPNGITYLADPERAAEEIRRNAARGFTSVSMPEQPHLIGLPSLWQREHWDPIIGACVETDTVLSLHVGSSGGREIPPGSPEVQIAATLFGDLSLVACAHWLWSGYPRNHPTLKLAMSEGGIGWVPMLLDRLDNMIDRAGYGSGWDERPSDVVRRNFWFCTIDDPSTIEMRHRIGVENIMVEVDYPHLDSTWPDTQQVIEKYWGHIPPSELRALCCENAAALYRHPLPKSVLPVSDIGLAQPQRPVI